MSETPNEDSQLNELRDEADMILVATDSTTNGPAWKGLSAEEQSAIAAARDRLISAQSVANTTAIRAAINALDQATRHLAEMVMDKAVQSAIRGGNKEGR